MPKKEFANNLDLLSYEFLKRKASSQEQVEAVWAAYRTVFPRKSLRSIDRRFPVKRDSFLVEFLLRIIKERDELKKELPEIRRQIDALKSNR